MKNLVPLYARVVSLLISVGITALLIGIHAVDLTALGAPDTVATSAPAAATAAAGSRYTITVADSRMR